MEWKSDAPQQVRDKAHSLPLDGLGKLSACSLPSKVANPARMGTRYAGGRNPWVCNSTNRLWGTKHFSQSPVLVLREQQEEPRWPAMMGWIFPDALRWILAVGGWCDLDLRIPGPLNRRFTHMVRVASVKMPRLLAFARHVEDSHY